MMNSPMRRYVLGSARDSLAESGDSPDFLSQISFRRVAETSTRVAGVPPIQT